LKQQLEDFLIFGQYPEIVVSKKREEKIEILNELVDSYLLKDILSLEKVKSSKLLIDLLKLLAFQVGQLISYHELGSQLHIDVKTVARYLDLLEKAFVIYKLGGFSRNLRKEITSKHKYYFYDNGIRNGIIRHFNPLEMRNDVGALWENYLILERLKYTSYQGFYGNRYFWRTYQGDEIDLIEEQDSQLHGYEFKWSEKKHVEPKLWSTTYPDATFQTISPTNYLNFIT
jgi:uncharacterized protein